MEWKVLFPSCAEEGACERSVVEPTIELGATRQAVGFSSGPAICCTVTPASAASRGHTGGGRL